MKAISCILSILCCTVFVRSDFPDISQIEKFFYQTEVQFTDLIVNISGYAKEYYDNTGLRGRIDVYALGEKRTIYYNNLTNEILDVSGTKCVASEADLSILSLQPIFYGWLLMNPLIIGPSAILHYGSNNRKLAVENDKATVRGIKDCDSWTIPITDARNDIKVTYYFAPENWDTPYKYESRRVPVRVEIKGESSQGIPDAEDKQPVNLLTDFLYFRPTVDNWLAFQLPVGIGCPGRQKTRELPKLPQTFRYSADVYDVLQKDLDNKKKTFDIEYQMIWYDYTRMVARLDKHDRLTSFSELYDFNTGVTYSVVDGETCTMKPLQNSYFEDYDDQLIGHMKEPSEVLNLKDTFYYMGERSIRGIWCDTFESAVTNDSDPIVFKKKELSRLVTTIYFSKESMIVAVDSDPNTKVPIYSVITGYDFDGKVSINLQINIFEFDYVVGNDIFASFDMDRCFPSVDDKAYFYLLFDVSEKQAQRLEEMDKEIIKSLRQQISTHGQVSNLRLPFVRADYTLTGIRATVLLLDRPPALSQFYKEFTGDVIAEKDYTHMIIEADTKETCAYSCVGYDDYTCFGFYWCNQVCFLKSKSITELPDPAGEKEKLGTCETWLRVTRDSTNNEVYLVEALQKLEMAVSDNILTIILDVNTTKDEEILIPAQEIIFGVGPYSGNKDEIKPYDIIIKNAKIDPKDESTEKVPDLKIVNDCYEACKNSDTLSCASFSFCPDSPDKECVLSSSLLANQKPDEKEYIKDKNCFIYSMKYLDLYIPYPGQSILTESGVELSKDVKTAEECAMLCKKKENYACRGFEFCNKPKACVFHSKHVLDLKPGELQDRDNKSQCTHYAAKYVADYIDLGRVLIKDDSNVKKETTLEECAKICSEELKGCKSFNYCPPSDQYATDSTCALSSLVITDKVDTTEDLNCRHYEKNSVFNDWDKKNLKVDKPPVTGYTSRGFTGLVIGMLAFGLIIGAIGFVAYSYYKSRSSGDGLTVRFMKQPT